MSDQLDAEANTFTIHNKQKRRNIHALSGIRTHNPTNGADADLRLRPHGHRDRPEVLLRINISSIKNNHSIDKPSLQELKKNCFISLNIHRAVKKTSNRKFAPDLNKVYILYYKIPAQIGPF
jgi:hypothetical protein